MKTKKSLIALATLKVLSVLAVLFVIVSLSSCATRKKALAQQPALKEKASSPEQEVPFVVVEEMPMFPGGDSTLLAYISKNTKYPESAKTNKIQGKVIVRFCVTSKGGVDRISVLKGVNPELDAEAARVVATLPQFKPGKQGGRSVPVWYMVPIDFSLK
jgi:periplasmic protein TonB